MFNARFIKKNGKLTYQGEADGLKYKTFVNKLEEGAIVEMFISLDTEKGSYAQISKIHASIRELSKESGYTFEEMKKLVKESAGLSFIVKDDGKDQHLIKSFAECTKDELSSVIQSCVEIGMNYNLNLG
jgi:hypothetical protein